MSDNTYNGVAFGEILNDIASRRDPYEVAAVSAAQDIHGSDGEIEIDENAICSRDDDSEGCYCLAWVWVPRSSMQLEVQPEEEESAHG